MGVVLITGCSSGFGLETALAFAANGDTVVATMRNVERAQILHKRAASAGVEIETLPLDVSSDESVVTTVHDVLRRHGGIDVLVNNAGVGHLGAVETMKLDLAREVLETNFWGTVRMIQAVLPNMRTRGDGVIINVSSIAGRLPPLPFSSWYAVSKHAVGLLSEALLMELTGTGVRVVSIEPGFFKTSIGLNASPLAANGVYAAEEAWIGSFYALGVNDGGDPADVATAIVRASADPSTPLHVTVPAELEDMADPRPTVSFEETATSQIELLEAVVGPRPKRGASD
jgi:NAD(P)-dependent dehydrogenase (short-subunit alcohol dehydrogenase family)